ncbi:MAG TPA: alpha-amylase family glycosyl hydrolase, partial [Fibrella sp.]
MVIPLGGTLPNGVTLGAGKYYIKILSRTNIYDNSRYVFHATTGKLGGSRWSPNKTPDVDLTAGFTNPKPLELGRNYLNRLWQKGANDQITYNDEFEVTVTAADFNASGDKLIMEAINPDGKYSNHVPTQIYYLPAGSNTSYNIANIATPFDQWYKLDFQTYTNFNNMPSGRGALDWNGFRPHFTNGSPAGYSQTTSLGPQYSMQSLDYFYDYDHNIPATRDLLIDWTKWAYDELGSKGIRMDAVKHFEPSFVANMLKEMNRTNRNPNMVVGEWYGENTDELKGWVDAVTSQLNDATRNAVPVKVFDFSLRKALKDALDNGSNARQVFFSSLRDAKGMSGFNVMTFLNNHDFRSSNTTYGDALVHNNPILGYAYILTNNQLGVPTVFYPDYYGYPARNSKFGNDTYGFDYHPTGLKPIKAEIDQLMKVLQRYINNSPGVDYLNHYGGTGNGPSSPNKYIEGSHNRCLLYQLRAPGNTGKEVIVAINFGDTPLRVDHQIAVRNGIAPGTRFADILGKSAFPYAQVDGQNMIYIGLPAKSYSVWVQDVAPLAATVAATPNSGTICPGQSATLTTTATGGTAPYTYSFSTGVSQTQPGSVGTATASGTYSVTVTDALGLTAVANVTLSVNPASTITRQPASQSAVCAGAPVSVSVEATGPGTLSYQWYKSSTNAPLTGQVTSALALPSAQLGDTDGYYCVVTSNCASLTSTAFTLTVNSTPAVPVLTSSGNAVCTPGSLTITSNCPTTTTWSVQGGTGETASTGTAFNNLYIVSAPSAYILTATCSAPAGCSSGASTPLSVTVNQAPAAPALTASNSGSACSGTSVTLTASTASVGTPPYTYSFPATGISGVDAASGTAVATASGTYSVTVTDGAGCKATSTEVAVTIQPSPVAALTPGVTAVCAGQPVTLSASPVGGTYRFSGTDIETQTNTTGSITFTPITASGTYSVTVTSANGCVSTNQTTATVTVNPLPAATLTADNNGELTCA